MIFDDNYPQQSCYYGAPRLSAETVDGLPVFDLHEHKGLLRGLPAGGKPMFWHVGGQLTPAARGGYDLVGVR